MAYLKEQAKWEEGIYQYELDDLLQGGEDGIDNVQGKQLANRTQYLKEIQEQHAAAANPHNVTAAQIGTYTKQEINAKIEDSYNWALVDESKARNLLDILGIRSVHSDEPATFEEIKKVMGILHERINPDGIPDFSDLRLCDYLDLPEINDGTTVYKWNGEYKNLRIMISAFNLYKIIGYPENEKNHIVFTFRNCVLTRPMNDSNANAGGYSPSKLASYLDGGFKTGLEAVLGNTLYAVYRALSKKGRWDWKKHTVFLPTEREVWGTTVWGERARDGGFQAQYPIFRDSALYKGKRHNGSRMWWWLASPTEANATTFCVYRYRGIASNFDAGDSGGVAPAFCVV